MSQFFKLAAEYCEEAYGCEMIEEKNVIIGFVCPNCGELIYSEDWTDEDTDNCDDVVRGGSSRMRRGQ